jgi:3-keto-disaccharide hydrolase
MKQLLALASGVVVSLVLVGSSSTLADEDFRPLFNGKDLSGWVPVNVAPETFTVRDGMIVSTGKPTGVMRTDRPYENFVMELEWRHLHAGGNAGLFVWSDALPALGVPFTRSFEVQILDGHETPNYTSHGDVFGIWGATMTPDRPHPAGWMRCLPSEKRARPSPEWNHYRVSCQDGVLKLAVNGKEVSGASKCVPRMGYICLESEGSECHFRNLRIKELPSTQPSDAERATVDEGFASLYSGLDLRGWRLDAGHEGHWRAKDSILEYDGKSTAKKKDLWTEKAYGDFVLMVDWRLPGKPMPRRRAVVLPNGDDAKNADGTAKTIEIPYAGDSGILLRGSERAQVNITCNTIGSGELYDYRVDKTMPAEVRSGAIPKIKADSAPGKWNRFLITMKKDRVTVILNGQTVIDQVPLPGIPERGPIGLQHHGDPVQFTNLFIKALE